MKVLELFAGTRSIGKAFEARGHEVFSVEWDKSFENIDLYKDVLQITPDEIIQKFGRPDVIWASPDCATYSIAAISRHRRRTAGGGYEPGSSFGICQVLRPRESARPRADHVAVADLVVHREPARRYAENGLYVWASAVHCNLLPIRGHPYEADRHLDKSPGPGVPATVPQWGPVPYTGPARGEDWDPGIEWEQGTVANTAGAVRTHRPYLRNWGPRLGEDVKPNEIK